MGRPNSLPYPSRSASRSHPVLWLLLLLGSGVTLSGCTRHFFREQADKEVADVLAEKDQFPQWRIEQAHVYPDPRARFADSSDPDHPPMPPDDPAAWKMSPHPQKPYKSGIARVEGEGYLNLLVAWDAENRADVA